MAIRAVSGVITNLQGQLNGRILTQSDLANSLTAQQKNDAYRFLQEKKQLPSDIFISVTNSGGAAQAFRLFDPDNFFGVANGANIAFDTNFLGGYAALLKKLVTWKICAPGMQVVVGDEAMFTSMAMLVATREFDVSNPSSYKTAIQSAKAKQVNDDPKTRFIIAPMLITDDFGFKGTLGAGETVQFTIPVDYIHNY